MKRKIHRSQKYRADLRYIRALLGPEHEALLMGEKISYMKMRDLEALVELVTGADPRSLAPNNYNPTTG